MANKNQEKNCPHCGSTDIRPSRVRSKDSVFHAFIYSPYRCRDCRKRHWVLSHRFIYASVAGVVAIAVVSGVLYSTSLSTTPFSTIALSDHTSATMALAEEGDINAQYELGIKYLRGEGLPPLKNEAVKWLSAAANQGHTEAQLMLTNTYLNYGSRDSQEFKKATQWLTQAANQGQPEAQYILGNMHAEGQGVIQDFQQAAKWLQLAANAGHVEAMYRLGMMHVVGDGVEKDRIQAYVWFNLAAAEGNHQAFIARTEVSELLNAEQINVAQAKSREWRPMPANFADNDTKAQVTQIEH